MTKRARKSSEGTSASSWRSDIADRKIDAHDSVDLKAGTHMTCDSCAGTGLHTEKVCDICDGFGVVLTAKGAVERARHRLWERERASGDTDERDIDRHYERELLREERWESSDPDVTHVLRFDSLGRPLDRRGRLLARRRRGGAA